LGSLGFAISDLDSAGLISAISIIAIVAIVAVMLVRSARLRKFRQNQNAAADLHHDQATLDSLPAAVVLLDASGKVCHFNDAWHKLSREQAFNLPDGGKGQHYRQVLRTLTRTPESDPETTLEAGIRRVAASRDQRFDGDLLTAREGNWPWFHVYVRTMEDDDDTNVLLMMVNISSRKRKQIDFDSTLNELTQAGYEARATEGAGNPGSLQRRASAAIFGFFRDLLRYNPKVKLAFGTLRTSPAFSHSIHDRPAHCTLHPNNKVAL
jgi:PAS domain-containing protein